MSVELALNDRVPLLFLILLVQRVMTEMLMNDADGTGLESTKGLYEMVDHNYVCVFVTIVVM